MSDNDELEISSKTLIVEDNFRIDRSGAPGRYDLYVKKIVNKGKKSEKESWDLIGYSYSLDTLLLTLTSILTDRKFGDTITTLKEYLNEYRKHTEWLRNLIGSKL